MYVRLPERLFLGGTETGSQKGEGAMIADPHDAHTWTVLSQASRAELLMLTVLSWLNTPGSRATSRRRIDGAERTAPSAR